MANNLMNFVRIYSLPLLIIFLSLCGSVLVHVYDYYSFSDRGPVKDYYEAVSLLK